MPLFARPFLAALLVALGSLTHALPAAAQPADITGRVTSAATGEGVPSATVTVEGTRRGTVTNADGAFNVRVERLPATLVVSAIGYASARRRVTSAGAVDVRLEPQLIELATFEVRGEDPAVRIMREVIAAKRRQRAALASYTAGAYTRFTIRNDTGIVTITETGTDVFWRRDGGTREIVRTQRNTANFPGEAFLPAAAVVLNLTDDEVEVAGFRFVGVTHPDALGVYQFALEGTRVLDGRRVFDLSLRPRDPLAVAFVGTIAVLDSAFALVEADLAPGAAFRFPAPVERYETRFRQRFSDFGQNVWLPADFRAETEAEVGFPGLRFPAFRIEQVSRLTDYAVNAPTPDSLYRRRRPALAVDTAAVRAATAAASAGADTLRGVPLTADEQAAYAGLDSTRSLARAFRPTGPLARFVNLRINGDDGRGRPARRPSPIGVSFAPRVWFNRVEELHAGAAVRPRLGPLALDGQIGYATATEDWDRRLDAALALGRVTLRGGAGRETAPVAASYVQTRLTNSANALLGRGDYFDYTRRTRYLAGIEAPFGRDVRAALTLRDERHEAVEAADDYFTVRGRRSVRANPVPAPGRLRSAAVGVRIGEAPPPLGILGGNAAALAVEHAAGWMGSAHGFTRATATLDGRLATFGRRRPFPAALDARFVAQATFGDRIAQRRALVEASQPGATPFGTLRTRQPVPYTAPTTSALFWEHNFRTLVWERLGWSAPTERGYSLIVHGAHAAYSERARVRLPFFAARGEHHELGASLSGLFGLLRLDFTARLDERAFTVGIAPARLF